MAVLSYPLNPPVAGGENSSGADATTGAIDYVMFHRHRINYNDTNSTQFYGRSLPDTDSASLKYDQNRVYLAMPKSLQTSYTANYRQADLGAIGVGALSFLGGAGDVNVTDLANTVAGAAEAGLPEFATNALANGINRFSQMLGLQGGLDGNSIQALTRGRVFNPFKEQIFSNINFRTHTFSFKLLSRNEDEAKRVKNIIQYFKVGALPRISDISNLDNDNFGGNLNEGFGGNSGFQLASQNRYFDIPESFDIKFIRVSADGSVLDTVSSSEMHFKIQPSVCTSIAVNYTPDGQYTSFKRYNGDMVQVPAIQLDMVFTEMKLVTAVDADRGY